MSPDEIVEALLDEAPRNPARKRMAELEAYLDHIDTTVIQDGDEEAHFPDGSPVTLCWGGADQVVRDFKGTRFGFHEREDIENSDTQGGHDFAVVDGRFIVDHWLKHVVGSQRGVFDMQDPRDAQLIKHYYGDPSQWEKDDSAERAAEVDKRTDDMYRAAGKPNPHKMNLDDPKNWPLT